MTPTEHAEAILKAIDWATLGAYRPEPFPALLAAVEAAMQDAMAEERGQIVGWLVDAHDKIADDLSDTLEAISGSQRERGSFNGYPYFRAFAVAIRDLAHKGAGDA